MSCPCSHLTTSSSSAVCSTAALVKTHALYRGVMEDIYDTLYHRAERRQLPVHGRGRSRWSYPYIREMHEAGVIDGTTPTTFEPASAMSRARS